MLKRPVGISIPKLKRDPETYSNSLTRLESVDTLKYLDFMYHSNNKSLVDDEVYDVLKDSVVERWPRTPYLKQVGDPTAKVSETVKLPVPMMSMDKCKPGTKALTNFLNNSSTIVLSDKLDGISLSVMYEKGMLTRAFTRGDGREGKDVSNLRSALNVPKRINIKTVLVVRLEFIIKSASFSKNSVKESGDSYKTARNMGGGLLTHNVPTAKVKAFDCVAYEITKGKGAGDKTSSQLKLLKQLGFTVVKHKVVKNLTEDLMMKEYNSFKKTARYEIDGVIMARDVGYRVSSSNPKHAKAFKVNSLESSKVITVKDVIYRLTRLNKWVPRVEVEPVQLGGVTVTYFAGHSYYYIQNGYTISEKRKAVRDGSPLTKMPINKGAKIRVIRSGDVIPYIMNVEKASRKGAQPPGDFELDDNGVHAVGVDTVDNARIVSIAHFFRSLDVDGLKLATVTKLVNSGFDSIGSILFAEIDELLEVDTIQLKTATNIVNNIDKALETANFASIGYASGVFGPAIGKRKLQSVINTYPNIVKIAKTATISKLDKLIKNVEGISTQSMDIATGLKDLRVFLDDVGLELGPEKPKDLSSSKLKDLNVLFTSVRDKELQAYIEDNGGTVVNTVNKANVIVIKPGASNNKTEKALELGIPLLTVDQFNKKYVL